MMKKTTGVLLALAVLSGPVWAKGPKLKGVALRHPATNCTADEQAAIDAALGPAKMRVFNVQQKYAEIAPPGPYGDDFSAKSRRLELDGLGRRIFGGDYETVDVDYYIRGMRDVLWSKPAIVCSGASDKHCGGRAGYVITGERSIHACPNFFNTKPGASAVDASVEAAEQRIRTLVHESAHVAGISEKDGKESYCGLFTCDSSCGEGASVADNWSEWVHCGSGQTPDQPTAITGSARSKNP